MNGGSVPRLVEQLVLLRSQFLLKRDSKILKGKSKKMLPNVGISDSAPHLLNFRTHSLKNSNQTALSSTLLLSSLFCTLYFSSYLPILEFIFYPFFSLRKLLLNPIAAYNQMTTEEVLHRFRI